ncbi:hypothetical protein, partial [Listeria monocytogenes]|uniref:hypothetical protein n=1 Tax=Listeria monocytogenes TaxID=1639 RepID=UPI000AAAFC3C
GYPYSVFDGEKLEFFYGATMVEGRRYGKENREMYLMFCEPGEIMSSYCDVTGATPVSYKHLTLPTNREADNSVREHPLRQHIHIIPLY